MRRFRGWACCRIDGSISQEERSEQIRSFNTDPEIKLFLLSTRAGGQGINRLLIAIVRCRLQCVDCTGESDLVVLWIKQYLRCDFVPISGKDASRMDGGALQLRYLDRS